MSPEKLMHLRLNHLVSYPKLEILSKSGARGISSLKCIDQKCNACLHANITRNPKAPASTGNDDADMNFDLVDMSKIATIGVHRYASVFVDKASRKSSNAMGRLSITLQLCRQSAKAWSRRRSSI
jgi:hypothetical protein